MAPCMVSKPFRCVYEISRQRLALKTSRSLTSPPFQRFASSCSVPFTGRNTTASSYPLSKRPHLYQQYRSKSHITAATAQARSKIGPISVISVSLFICAGVGLYFYFNYEKARMERQRIAEASKGMGRPKVGAPFELLDQNGQTWSSDKMKGKFSLMYFGFSHCPDICPEELDKMAMMLDIVEKKIPSSSSRNPELLPVFITCDPARDTPAVLKSYLAEFHSRLIGLTGTWEQVKAVCKSYRVYFSTPPGVKAGDDYLVDHSIYFYLMDPEGDFVEAIGRQHTAEDAAKLITDHMTDWKGNLVKD